jgi:hypothetical protein
VHNIKKPAGRGLFSSSIRKQLLLNSFFSYQASFPARFTGSLRAISEIPSAYLTAFPSGFCRALRILSKITGSTTFCCHKISNLG